MFLCRSAHIPFFLQLKEAPFTFVQHTQSMSFLQELIAGRNGSVPPQQPTLFPKKCKYVAAIEILSSIEEHTLVNFQGVLFWCETEARQVLLSQHYCGRKKYKAAHEVSVAELVLVDQTGPVKVVIWGNLALEITTAWKLLQRARALASTSVCEYIVDLQRVHVYSLPKNDWNGLCLTRMRYLRSVDNPAVLENATSLNMIAKPFASNLLDMHWVQPPSYVCISEFDTIKTKLQAPFRITIQGMVTDVAPANLNNQGNVQDLFCCFH